jgi:hypothetical protein
MIIIDISGPKGNAFWLLGAVDSYGEQLEWPQEKIESLRAEMGDGDYEHLVATFNRAFDPYVRLALPKPLVFDETELEEGGPIPYFDPAEVSFVR